MRNKLITHTFNTTVDEKRWLDRLMCEYDCNKTTLIRGMISFFATEDLPKKHVLGLRRHFIDIPLGRRKADGK